jgi:hypothetical protein
MLAVRRTPMPNVTAERYAQGMTFDEYVRAVGSPQNLKRQGTGASVRQDTTAVFKAGYENTRLNDSQVEALKWLTTQPAGPAKILVISEDWSSDCQREVPTMARIAEAAGMELRIFNRDGDTYSGAQRPEDSPNADLMSQFLNNKRGETWQSIPVIAFFTKDMEHLYTFIEYPAIYDKDRLVVAHIRGARPGESAEETQSRGGKEFGDLRAGPFWKIWTSAAVDEMISALQRRVVLGAV